LDLESNLWRTMLRTDENLSRPTFRFSPEWKRTRAPDNLGPQIDARLAGVERQGDTILVHSLNGNERNHYFANRPSSVAVPVLGPVGARPPSGGPLRGRRAAAAEVDGGRRGHLHWGWITADSRGFAVSIMIATDAGHCAG
jgi:hypothetical protein